jgi:hypothetical protein
MMPIVQAFSPNTGAAIGGGDGPQQSASLYNVPLQEVNLTDGSWTLLDPDSSLKSVTFSGGFNTITLNARTANENNRWDGGTTCTMPRWYKDFQIDGTDITVDDVIQFISRLERDTATGTNFNPSFVVGIANDPTSTTLTTIRGNGGIHTRVGTGNLAYGTWQNNASTTGTASGNDFGLCSLLRGYNGLGSGTYLNINITPDPDTVATSGSRNSNVNASGTADGTTVKIMVAPGARANTDAIPADAVYKMKVHIGGIVWNKV